MQQDDRVERIVDISTDDRVDKAMGSQSFNFNGVDESSSGDLDGHQAVGNTLEAGGEVSVAIVDVDPNTIAESAVQ
ncbi:hypothetical protein Y032_0272g916 [Ancylostoma ceylanicum]|nr:hypothetical protein Y032_0272g916 [Ancylostoma ceylanicum]